MYFRFAKVAHQLFFLQYCVYDSLGRFADRSRVVSGKVLGISCPECIQIISPDPVDFSLRHKNQYFSACHSVKAGVKILYIKVRFDLKWILIFDHYLTMITILSLLLDLG